MSLFHKSTIILSFLVLFSIPGCDRGTETNTASDQEDKQVKAEDQERIPPSPPLFEDFEGNPVLSLFPRVGDYQPDLDDDRHPFWRTFIDHFNKVSGLVTNKESSNHAWSYRSINTIDSVAFFSPVKVEPSSRYRISIKVRADLPEGAKTGVGILEFDDFLWDGEQYTEVSTLLHLLKSQVAIEMTETFDWDTKNFEFQTTPRTEMIHLVFYREGTHSRSPVLIDDIRVEKVGQEIQSKNNSQ